MVPRNDIENDQLDISFASDPSASQPTQLLQHALAPQDQVHSTHLDPPKEANSVSDFSLDSRIIPARSATPRYHLQGSFLQSSANGDECVVAEDFQILVETRQKNGQPPRIMTDTDPIHGSGSDFFPLHGDSPISASVGKAIGSFRPSPTTPGHPLSRPSKSMSVEKRNYRRSPSFPSQDSFAGSVSQDPAELYLASTKQFNVPLSDLGDTPTQEVIHSPTDPGITLPDASEHKEFLEAAMREYEAQRANGLIPNRVLVVATPDSSDESSGAPHHKHDNFSFHNGGQESTARESTFEFNDSSSFDKMLDRDLTDGPDPTPDPTHFRETEDIAPVDVECPTEDVSHNTSPRSTPPPFEWIAPIPSTAVASSNPRSLLRMVHPNNQYRIAKMRLLAGNVEPPSCVSTGTEMESNCMEETQPCHGGDSHTLPPIRPTSRQIMMPAARHREVQVEVAEDELDIIPDSEPLRAGPSTQTPSHHRTGAQSPKKPFRTFSPMSGDLVPDSLEVEEDEVDVPLSVEVTSRNPKRSVAPTKNLIVCGRNARTASSAAPEQAPALSPGNQPRRPVRPSKTEPTEVPTSLPEQDLQGQAFSSRRHPTATTSKQPSKKKRNSSDALERSRARQASATKPIVGKKRARKSDTETSDDSMRQPAVGEAAMNPRKNKEEEEEESEYADDNLPPPPPLKADTSRRKRTRNEDVKPARGMSNVSSTRTNSSETPAVATRSAKRLRSGIPSARGLTAEPATQVFALWKQDGHYYSGVVHSRGLKNKYLVKFDDNTEDEVELKNMRRRELLVGDRVIIIQDNVKGEVRDVSHADSRGSIVLEADNGKEITTRSVAFKDVRIANRTIHGQWKKRMVVAENIVTVVRQKPSIDTTPSRQSVASTISSQVQQELVKTGFVVTINPKNEKPTQMKDEAMRAIKQRGGLVIEDWSSVFTMEGKHSQSNRRWIATPQDFRWKLEVNMDRVFLLSDDAHQKPKFLLALALGIPCLSFEWLTRKGHVSSDWQPFLLPAGYSDTLGARISQLVDLDWGNCTEHLTDIMDSRVPIKLFSRKTVLCVGAELVPLPQNRAKKNNLDEASRYVPWIILCMGATKVEAVTDTKQVTPAYMKAFDYIIVKERDVLGSLNLGNVVVGDVTWVKECLVSSRLSKPEVE